MSIETDCFLSPEISDWVIHNRAQATEWFDLAHALNRLYLASLQALSVQDSEERKIMAALLFVRGGSNLQAAVILTERGLTGEARTIIRSCFETAFYLGALVNDAEYVGRLKLDETARKTKYARALLNRNLGDEGLSEEGRNTLAEYLEEVGNSAAKPNLITIQHAAETAGMSEVYDVYYRALSNDGAHPSLLSLLRNVGYNAEGFAQAFRHGPDAPNVKDTIVIACVAVIYIMDYGLKFLALPESNFMELWGTFRRLTDREVAANSTIGAA